MATGLLLDKRLSVRTLRDSRIVVDEAACTGATFTTLLNPDGDGKNYRLGTWTTATLKQLAALSPGLAEIACIGAGGGGAYRAQGGAGAVRWGSFWIPAGVHAITVGTGGVQGDNTGSDGGWSAIGDLLRAGGGMGGMGGNASQATAAKSAPDGGGSGGGMQINTWGGPVDGGGAGGSGFPGSPTTGVILRITGFAVEYGKVAAPNTPGSSGGAGANVAENGADGALYVRWEI